MSGYRLEFEPALAEEAVLRAVAAAPPAEQRRFRRQRDPLYEVGDEDRRESGFRELHGRWLELLGVAAACRELVEAESMVVAGTSRGIFVRAASARRQHADLRDERAVGRAPGPALPVLTVALSPETLADRRRLRSFLGRELVFVSDLLDPEFGYRSERDSAAAAGGLQQLIVQRYRVLWGTSVDGRLAARGRLPAAAAKRCRMEFLATFWLLGEAAGPAFERIFHGPRRTHAELADFARDPRAACGLEGGGIACPVCGMPSFRCHPDPALLRGEVVAAIRAAAPGWQAEHGLCQQCADLFSARADPAAGAGATVRPA